MTIREELLQEIDGTPDAILEQVLNFLLFLKARHSNGKLDNAMPSDRLEPLSSEQFSTAGSLLRHFGTWEGDDIDSESTSNQKTLNQEIPNNPQLSTGRTFLENLDRIGRWEGDDLQECLEMVTSLQTDIGIVERRSPFA